VMIKSESTCKNKISFVPRELMVMSSDSGYTMISTMWANNSYGAKGEHKAYFSLDAEGTITKQF
jgi:hypothetical protein